MSFFIEELERNHKCKPWCRLTYLYLYLSVFVLRANQLLCPMSSDLFVMEVAAWTASLTSDVAVPEIGGIVKFLNFKPFQFFRQIPASGTKEENSVFNIRKSKSALFRCDVNQLQSLLSNIPLYVVLAQWSDEDQEIARGQKLIGVASIALTKLSPIALSGKDKPNRTEIRTISGLFPIRDLLGRAVGQIHLRVQLTEMNCSPRTIQPSEDAQGHPLHIPTVNSHMLRQSRVVCMSQQNTGQWESQTSHPRSTLVDQAVQHDSPEAGNPNRARTGHELSSSVQTKSLSPRSHEGLHNEHQSTDLQLKICKTVHKDSRFSSPEKDELPILRSLMKELQTLRSNKDIENECELETVLSFLSSKGRSKISDRCHECVSCPLAKSRATSSPPFNDSRQQLQNGKLMIAADRRHRIDLMAQPKKKLPSPGLQVPKDRGWIRSAPIYRGTPRTNITFRANNAHLLRLQHIRSKMPNTTRSYSQCDSHPHATNGCDFQTPRLKTTKSQMDKFEQTNSPSAAVPKNHEIQRHGDISPAQKELQTHRLSYSASLEVCTSEQLPNPSDKLVESPNHGDQWDTPTCVALAISTNSTTPSPTPRKTSPSLCAHQNALDKPISTEIDAVSVIGTDEKNLDKNFTRFKPQQSSLSPQVSCNQTKFVGLTQIAPRSLCEKVGRLDVLSSTTSTLTQERISGATEDVSEVSQLTTSPPGLHGKPLRGNRSQPRDSSPSEHTRSGSHTGQTASGGSPRRSEQMTKSPSEYEEDSDFSDESVLPKPLSHKIAPMDMHVNSEDQTDADRTVLVSKLHSITNPTCSSDRVNPATGEIPRGSSSFDATSFTRVTTQLERRDSHRNQDGSLDTTVRQPRSSKAANAEERNKFSRAQDFEFPMFIELSEQATDYLDDIDIEAMRSRGSHDYIFGGSHVP